MKPKEILLSLEKDVELVHPQIKEWWLNYLQKQSERYLDTLEFMGDMDKDTRLLEIGSLPGHFTVLLKQLGYQVRGVDLDYRRAESLWRKYDITVDEVDIETQPLPYEENRFDLVLFMELLEHLRINPVFTLRQLYRVLKPGGKIILSTPNVPPHRRFRFFLYGHSYQDDLFQELEKLETVGHMGHFRLYILSEVKHLLESVGFKTIKYDYRGQVALSDKRIDHVMYWLHPRKQRFRSVLYYMGQKENPTK